MRDRDTWHKINYSNDAASWMKPLVKGSETGLVCIPANWCDDPDNLLLEFVLNISPFSRYLDDMEPLMYVLAASSYSRLIFNAMFPGSSNHFRTRRAG